MRLRSGNTVGNKISVASKVLWRVCEDEICHEEHTWVDYKEVEYYIECNEYFCPGVL